MRGLERQSDAYTIVSGTQPHQAAALPTDAEVAALGLHRSGPAITAGMLRKAEAQITSGLGSPTFTTDDYIALESAYPGKSFSQLMTMIANAMPTPETKKAFRDGMSKSKAAAKSMMSKGLDHYQFQYGSGRDEEFKAFVSGWTLIAAFY